MTMLGPGSAGAILGTARLNCGSAPGVVAPGAIHTRLHQSLASGDRLALRKTGENTVKLVSSLAFAGIVATATLPAAALDISGAGATFPYPIYAKWADVYKKE